MKDDNMGHPDNITNQTLKHLAEKRNISLQEMKKFVYDSLSVDKPVHDAAIDEMFEKAAKAWGQSVEEAKSEARKMLKQELKTQE